MSAKPLPQAVPAGPTRPKALAITADHIETVEQRGRLRSPAKKKARRRSRELVDQVMRTTRATALDVADSLAVNERVARRSLEISEDASAMDISEPLAMAASGPGGVRLAKGILMALLHEIDRIAFSSSEH